MKTYIGYEIPEMKDLINEFNIDAIKDPNTPTLDPKIIFTKNGNTGKTLFFETGLLVSDVVDLSEAEANELIYKRAIEKIDGLINKNDKVCEFPTNLVKDENPTEDITEEVNEAVEKLETETKEDPRMTIENARIIVKHAKEMVTMLGENWKATVEELKLHDDKEVKELYQYNIQHREERPKDFVETETDKWDNYNGLDNISEDELRDIFGVDSVVMRLINIDVMRQRAKEVLMDFINYLSASKEYRQMNDGFIMLIEEEEKKNIKELELMMEQETDPEKKKVMKQSLDDYYNMKYLYFLRDEISEKDIEILVKAFGDEKKINYWMKRSIDKLRQIGIDPKFIMEISHFETRFLPEEYHCVDNMLLEYIIRTIAFANMGDKNDDGRTRVTAMNLILDNICQNRCNEEEKNIVLENIKTFLNQFIKPVTEMYPEVLHKKGDNNEI